jgi:hypothetical protein
LNDAPSVTSSAETPTVRHLEKSGEMSALHRLEKEQGDPAVRLAKTSSLGINRAPFIFRGQKLEGRAVFNIVRIASKRRSANNVGQIDRPAGDRSNEPGGHYPLGFFLGSTENESVGTEN